MEQNKAQDNVIYIRKGYIDTSGINSEPYYNSSYPNAFSTSPIKIDAGDLVYLKCENASNDGFYRIYDEDGTVRTGYELPNNWKSSKDIHIRICVRSGEIITSCYVKKTDGIIIDYKIIDLR